VLRSDDTLELTPPRALLSGLRRQSGLIGMSATRRKLCGNPLGFKCLAVAPARIVFRSAPSVKRSIALVWRQIRPCRGRIANAASGRQARVGRVDQHRDLDLGGGDGADVDRARGQGLKTARATPAWLRMPMPITETLGRRWPLRRCRSRPRRGPCRSRPCALGTRLAAP